MYSSVLALPPSDESIGGANEFVNLLASEEAGVTRVTFERPLDTGTPGDLVIPNSLVQLQYAFSSGSDASNPSFSKHSSAGTGPVNFLAVGSFSGVKPDGFKWDAGLGVTVTVGCVFLAYTLLRALNGLIKCRRRRALRAAVRASKPDLPGSIDVPADRRTCYFRGSDLVTQGPHARNGKGDDLELSSLALQELGPMRALDAPVRRLHNAIAAYDFEATSVDELSLRIGEEVHVVDTFDDGWCAVTHSRSGLSGVVPMAYLVVKHKPQPVPPGAGAGASASRAPARDSGPAGHTPGEPGVASLSYPAQPAGVEPVLPKRSVSRASNIWFRMLHARVPFTDYNVLDVCVALLFIFVCLGWIHLWPGADWQIRNSYGAVTSACSLFTALPATRNSLLAWLLGLEFDRTIMFHRWLGRWTLIMAVVHFALYVSFWYDNRKFGVKPSAEIKLPANLFGLSSLIAGLVIFLTSIAWLRRHRFEFFYWSHYLFVAWYCLACYHTPKFRPYAMAACAAYGLDRLVRFFWGLYPRKSLALVVKDCDLVMVRFRRHPLAHHTLGNYVFLNFPQLSLEWHPYTLSSSPLEPYCEVHIKALGNHTRKLVEAARKRTHLWVRCDGPYGKLSLTCERYPALVLVSAGVGVTPMAAILKTLYHVNASPEQMLAHPRSQVIRHVYFIWVAQNEGVIGWFAEAIAAARARSQDGSGYPALHTYLFATRQQTTSTAAVQPGRPDIRAIFAEINAQLDPSIARIAVYACGPDELVAGAWDAANRHSKNHRRFDTHRETFNF